MVWLLIGGAIGAAVAALAYWHGDRNGPMTALVGVEV